MKRPVRSALAAVLIAGLSLAGVTAAQAAPEDDAAEIAGIWEDLYEEYFTSTEEPILDHKLLAAASPDECIVGVGNPYPEGTLDGNGLLVCPEGSELRTNQAYVWGLAKSGDDLFFGTGPNPHCLVIGGFFGATGSSETESWVCEGGSAEYRDPANNPAGIPVPAALGDWRPPDLFVYRQADADLIKLNDELDAAATARRNTTIGIRSAGATDGRIFFAGPGYGPGFSEVLNVFVFNEDGTFVGSESIEGYANIRKWIEVDGELYTGVRRSGNSGDLGEVLRLTGSSSADPFQFEVVGTLATEAAELAIHDGRMFVSTWPAAGTAAGLFMSPSLGGDGKLTAADADGWEQVWSVSEYEPDPVTAQIYGGGALVSFEGELYWGTMHVPGLATFAHLQFWDDYYETADSSALVTAALGSWRAVSLFRGDDFDSSPEVELLYGEQYLPAFDGTSWAIQPNNLEPGGGVPLLGRSGYGNPFNNYTWTMEVFDGSLYVGTMDWSYLIQAGLAGLFPDPTLEGAMSGAIETMAGVSSAAQIPLPHAGADIWRFDHPNEPAVGETLDGVGNHLSYGVRTMISDDALYVGMANPMNLEEEGGWQLLRLENEPFSVENLPATGASAETGILIATILLLAGAGLAFAVGRRRVTA